MIANKREWGVFTFIRVPSRLRKLELTTAIIGVQGLWQGGILISAFGFRASFGLRPSAFGFQVKG
jgi:hypothetical protein